jgi:hypothetical protein
MKTIYKNSIYLSVIALGVMVMLAGCASSPPNPEDTVPGPATPGPGTGKEPPAQKPQPGATAPGVTTPPPVKPKPGPETAYFVHTVKWRGESVSIIAGWYTGDIQNWKVLKEHNPDINPRRIYEGNKIRIPEYLMKTKAPLPKEYVDSFYTKPTKKDSGRGAPPPSPSTDNGEEPALFGPK